jgi:hypothetical protein
VRASNAAILNPKVNAIRQPKGKKNEWLLDMQNGRHATKVGIRAGPNNRFSFS